VLHINESSVRIIKLSQAAIMASSEASMKKNAKEYVQKAGKATTL
jgi:hypothetical protein